MTCNVYYNYWDGQLTNNTTWSGQVIVGENLVIPSNVSLTVQNGTEINFVKDSHLEIYGPININGTITIKDYPTDGYTITDEIMHIFSDQITLQNNAKLKIAQGGPSVIIDPGSTFLCSSGSKIEVYGKFFAEGTSANMINFTSSTNWAGIYFGSGSSGILDYCLVEKVQGYGSPAIFIYNASPEIKNSTIRNHQPNCYGIYVNGWSAMPLIYKNTFQNIGIEPIYVYQSSAFIICNNITTVPNIAAIKAYNNAYLKFGDTSNPNYIYGYNTMTGGKYGIYANYYCTIYASFGAAYGSRNRFLDNSYTDAYANDHTYIYAQENWWGVYPPDPSKIIAQNYSTIDYSYPLRRDPGPGFEKIFISNPEVNREENGIDENESNETILATENPVFPQLLYSALNKRQQGRFKEAIEIYMSIITNYSSSEFALISLIELANVYKESKDESIIPFLETFINYSNEIAAISMELLMKLYWLSKDQSRALYFSQRLQNVFQNSQHEKYGAIGEFYIYFDSGEFPNAYNTLQELQTNYPGDEEVRLLELLWNISQENIQVPFPKEMNITQEQRNVKLYNYPNPFNPATTIAFDLPRDVKVRVEIFDVSGRLICTLVDEPKEAGTHHVIWNGQDNHGNSVASGVYVYRLQAGDFVQARKMLFMK